MPFGRRTNSPLLLVLPMHRCPILSKSGGQQGNKIKAMKVNNSDYEKLKQLEESLWRSGTRFDNEYMNRTLAPDFIEFGRSGRAWTREEILSARPKAIDIKFPLKNFNINLIDANVALLTYVSEVTDEEVEVTNRSSIWSKTAVGWQIRFHQGTPTV